MSAPSGMGLHRPRDGLTSLSAPALATAFLGPPQAQQTRRAVSEPKEKKGIGGRNGLERHRKANVAMVSSCEPHRCKGWKRPAGWPRCGVAASSCTCLCSALWGFSSSLPLGHILDAHHHSRRDERGSTSLLHPMPSYATTAASLLLRGSSSSPNSAFSLGRPQPPRRAFRDSVGRPPRLLGCHLISHLIRPGASPAA